ncbi:MAG TPA: tyrosine-type recombinase/integrase, partial [Miltoncostaeaceae bacterium]|nr:tyrosine-type recombinase/integrase [Miltoncostaeaceae bacterium]
WHFTRAVSAAGLPARTTPHDLRHTFASTLLDAGCSIKELQVRLGHSSAKITLDTYAHLMPDSNARVREASAANVGRIVSLSCPPAALSAA